MPGEPGRSSTSPWTSSRARRSRRSSRRASSPPLARYDVRPPRRRKPGRSREVDDVCLRALDRDPARRYANANELATDLALLRSGESTSASALRRAAASRRRPLLGAGVALVLVAAAGLVWLLASGPGRVERARRALVDAEARAAELPRALRGAGAPSVEAKALELAADA